jgi:hypothetical protein
VNADIGRWFYCGGRLYYQLLSAFANRWDIKKRDQASLSTLIS